MRVEADLGSTGTAAATKSIYDEEGNLAMTFLLEFGPTEEVCQTAV